MFSRFQCLLLLNICLACQAFVVQHQSIQRRQNNGLASRVLSGLAQQEHLRINQYGLMPSTSISEKAYVRLSTQRHLGLENVPEPVMNFLTSVSRNTGGVPLAQAFGINALAFSLLLKPLSKMLTGAGIINALILGTLLWTTLGWRGWSVCVAYLFAGSLVTKVGFEKKEKLGIAEGRGGKRGPDNLWYVSIDVLSVVIKNGSLYFVYLHT